MTVKAPGNGHAANPFEGRDHIVVGIGWDEHGPFWSDLSLGITPVTLETAIKNQAWHREHNPRWDVRIFRIEEVTPPAGQGTDNAKS